MGLFKDMRNLRKQAQQMMPPEYRGVAGGMRGMRDGMARMSDMMAGFSSQLAENQDLMANGIVGQATITDLFDTGGSINDNPQVEFRLRVELPGREPYDATVRQVISRLSVFNYQPGSVVQVRVSRDNPQTLMIG